MSIKCPSNVNVAQSFEIFQTQIYHRQIQLLTKKVLNRKWALFFKIHFSRQLGKNLKCKQINLNWKMDFVIELFKNRTSLLVTFAHWNFIKTHHSNIWFTWLCLALISPPENSDLINFLYWAFCESTTLQGVPSKL